MAFDNYRVGTVTGNTAIWLGTALRRSDLDEPVAQLLDAALAHAESVAPTVTAERLKSAVLRFADYAKRP
jgi:hypothetical protein